MSFKSVKVVAHLLPWGHVPRESPLLFSALAHPNLPNVSPASYQMLTLVWWVEISSIISREDAFVRQVSKEGSHSYLKQDPHWWSGIWKGCRDRERKFTYISKRPGLQFWLIVEMQSRNQAGGWDAWGRDNVKSVAVPARGSPWDHARALQAGCGWQD